MKPHALQAVKHSPPPPQLGLESTIEVRSCLYNIFHECETFKSHIWVNVVGARVLPCLTYGD